MSVMRLTPTVAVAVFLCAVLPGAASKETPAFEVASIKPNTLANAGITVTFDGERFPSIDPDGPSILTAIPEQLGLKLEFQTSDVDVLVIDHVEHPSED